MTFTAARLESPRFTSRWLKCCRSPTSGLRPWLIRIGPVLRVAGLGALTFGFAIDVLAFIVLAQILIGAAYGASWAYTSQTIMEAAVPHERDRASALLPTIQSAGYGIGAAVAGLIANSAGIAQVETPGALAAALIVTFGVCTALALASVVAAFAMTRAPIG